VSSAKSWGAGVVVCSGGADSTVLLYMLHMLQVANRAVFFDYGQVSADRQAECVAHAAGALGIKWQRVKLTMPTTTGGVYQRGFRPSRPDDADGRVADGRTPLSGKRLDQWRRTQWSIIEGRNSIFVTWAAGLASQHKLRRVYVGFQEEKPECAEDDNIDTTRPFVESINSHLQFGVVTREVLVVAPFLDLGLNKQAIWKTGKSLGVDFSQTYSCEFYPACRRCGACRRRARAIARVG
jgi:7-cyano-7-deazaguanine synthase in queuosine biosynthesis